LYDHLLKNYPTTFFEVSRNTGRITEMWDGPSRKFYFPANMRYTEFVKSRLFLGIFAIFALIGSAAFGGFSENSRRGFDRAISDSITGSTPAVSSFTADFVAWEAETNVGLRGLTTGPETV